jgi:hypothetical protein
MSRRYHTTYEARGCTLFRAKVANDGTMTIRELPHKHEPMSGTTRPFKINPKITDQIVTDLANAEMMFDDGAELNAETYWILDQAHARLVESSAHCAREPGQCAGLFICGFRSG